MTKRKLIYVPEINPTTFLFFFSKGDSGRSFTFRDYSQGTIILTHARQYPYTDQEILAKARWAFNAPAHETNDIPFWRAEVESLNRQFLSSQPLPTDAAYIPSALQLPQSEEANSQLADMVLPAGKQVPKYPLLNLDGLLNHPVKGAKPQDLERIFTSAQSEDYVTWNVVQLLLQQPADQWWSQFIQLIKQDNSNVTLKYQVNDRPTLDIWKRFKSPVTYEQRSRQRMAQSGNPLLVERSNNMRSVEGNSEIDLVISGKRYIIFVEAKLGSDISMATQYDPARNQIIRNIDIALEEAQERTPLFLLLVKDAQPKRAYVHLLRDYQRNPQALFQALSHRKPEEIKPIVPNLALILWEDLLRLIENVPADVGNELQRRIALS